VHCAPPGQETCAIQIKQTAAEVVVYVRDGLRELEIDVPPELAFQNAIYMLDCAVRLDPSLRDRLEGVVRDILSGKVEKDALRITAQGGGSSS
jgi:hypothetical protein